MCRFSRETGDDTGTGGRLIAPVRDAAPLGRLVSARYRQAHTLLSASKGRITYGECSRRVDFGRMKAQPSHTWPPRPPQQLTNVAVRLQLGIMSAQARAIPKNAGLLYVEHNCLIIAQCRPGLEAPARRRD